MATNLVPPAIEVAILSSATQRTRRVEIHEQDGKTLWMDCKDRLKAGSVGVTYGDDTRRTFDITLDNSDGMLKENPSGGLWYDKVIKIFSGVRLPTPLGEKIMPPNTNLCLGKPVTISPTPTATAPAGMTSAKITDGKIGFGSNYFIVNQPTGLMSATVDLGQVWTIDTVKIWHLGYSTLATFPEVFQATKTEVSPDGIVWTTVFDSARAGTYRETVQGNVVTFLPRGVRYIRDWVNGYTYGGNFTAQNIWAEIQAFQTPLEWETQVGEFVIDKISSQNWPMDVKISGRDYVKRGETSKFTQSTTFPQGWLIEQVISYIASNARIYKQRLSPTYRTTQRDFTFDRGSTRWDAIKAIAGAYGLEAYFDRFGYLVLHEAPDPAMEPIAYRFETGSFGNIASYTRATADTELYNHVLVTGESSDSNVPPVWAETMNTEPNSPTNIDNLGDRLYTYTSSFITTVQQAKTVALAFLKVHALEAYEITMNTLVIPWLDAGAIIEFLDPDPITNQPTRYLLSGFTIPLGLGTMDVTGKRVTIVSDNGQGGMQGLGRVLYQPGLNVDDLVVEDDDVE